MIGKITSSNKIIEMVRRGEIDINNQELFFSALIKGLLDKLDDKISIRNNSVPHFIIHTGDDTMYLNAKGYNNKYEVLNISVDEIYNIIPRCIVAPGSIDLSPDQLSSPYTQGTLQFEYDDMLYSLSGEFRRMPIKLSCEIKYYIDSYKDMLALIQQAVSKLAFIQTFNITYMGQLIKCSYKIPDSFGEEHTMDIDGSTTDSKLKTLTLSLEVESVFPVWNERTIVSSDLRVSKVSFGRNDFYLQGGNTDSGSNDNTQGSTGSIGNTPGSGLTGGSGSGSTGSGSGSGITGSVPEWNGSTGSTGNTPESGSTGGSGSGSTGSGSGSGITGSVPGWNGSTGSGSIGNTYTSGSNSSSTTPSGGGIKIYPPNGIQNNIHDYEIG